MNTEKEIVVTKQREMHTHLGCKVEVETVFDTRTRLTLQNITLSTSKKQQEADAADEAEQAFSSFGMRRRSRS